jgi:hypothetical protein
MTVRALADNPEAARAFFDQYGVFLTDEEKIVGVLDYSVVGKTIYESHDADDLTCQSSC